MPEDLKDLKAGDIAVLEYNNYRSAPIYRLVRVEKVTPSGLLKVGGDYYNTKNGKKRGGSYESPMLVLRTEKISEEIARQRLASQVEQKLAKTRVRDLPVETLQALDTALSVE